MIALPPEQPSSVGSSYGDVEIMSRYCGLRVSAAHYSGEWQHGWIWREYNVHPEMIVGTDGLSRTRKAGRYFVARQDQADALQAAGYPDVHAIGLPILYLDPPTSERIKGSLLVMPSHSLRERNEGWDGEDYARHLSGAVGRFSKVGLCLTGTCIAKGYWRKLHPLAHEVYTGAVKSDVNSLQRLAILFRTYEYVTTNDFGSHVPYAAFFGAKVSVTGPRVRWDEVDAEASTLYRNCPECLPLMRRVKSEDVFVSYRELCVDPWNAEENAAWARDQLGASSTRSPSEIVRLFRWRRRDALRRRAGMIFRAGTRKLRDALPRASR